MNRGKNILGSGVLVIGMAAMLSACKDKTEAPKGGGKPRGLSAIGYVVAPASFSDLYIASGSLLPNEEINILPEVSGRVTGIHFNEGSAVAQGQLLVQLYDEEIKAQLQKLKAQRELQLKTQQRQKSLVDIGGISRQEYETTQTQVQSIEADIAYAEAQLRATKIIAPFSGNIGIRNISVGAVVTPSTIITTLQQTHPLKMDFNVPDQYRNSVKNGKKVLFSVNGMQDTLTGTITAVDPGADAVTRTIRVRASVPNHDKKLVAGSFARILVPLQSDSNAIMVPSQSVIPTTKDKLVAVVRNGKADMVKVILGARTEDKVEILNGLSKGDTILTTGI
ncbi:MAG: efflux RND transporter periplasmic adaptor subunit, partial [Chitinophagaceae bacterium]|nr:efflux RND transporter periplasmic adaptor subunit [Chitinophagaceae bacterium]